MHNFEGVAGRDIASDDLYHARGSCCCLHVTMDLVKIRPATKEDAPTIAYLIQVESYAVVCRVLLSRNCVTAAYRASESADTGRTSPTRYNLQHVQQYYI